MGAEGEVKEEEKARIYVSQAANAVLIQKEQDQQKGRIKQGISSLKEKGPKSPQLP